ncbi:Ig-like domain-containing protein [Heyndrickxia sporothermodurans]|uniref:Ig-like domain-containing protein n=1 Tax=Heyndrickxia sporothermodurans TaxID=46224 RepID=UPI0035DAA8F1
MKQFKKMKKIALMMIIFFLAFSSAFAGTKANAQTNSSTKSQLKQSLNKKNRLGELKNSQKYKSNEKVRVIVELKGQPAIEYATKQGKRYKDLPKSKQASLQSDVNKQQTNFISDVKEKKINLKVENKFTTVVNGISGHIEYGKINELKKLPNVANVYITNKYERPKVTPQMISSKDLVGAKETWDLKYKGDGMVVGVIDTGIDSSHKDMILSDNKKAKLSENSVKDIITKDKLPGKYYTEKVPYGYNYADKNDEIRDLGPDASMHGMHVSGTVAANGDEKNGGIQGVAPEAQLLALKVFGNDPAMPSTFGDIYIKAIDDGIQLGADVMNMSLGSTASFVDKNDPEQQAIKRAVDNGVLMSISAGNSTNIGGGTLNPLASNPDIGLVGSPSLSPESISVASFENSKMQVDGLEYDINGEKGTAAYLSASSVHPNDVKQKTFDVLAAGIGDVTDFEGKDFKGKYALVQRGTLDFVTKTKNAQAAGAAGVIIYNNQTGLVSMASEAAIKIPQLFMLQADGEKLKAELDKGKAVKITFKGEKSEIDNPSAGQMSDFTSWGVTPNLDFKPEITAPGGQIYSTLNNNQYGLMSGTSMAAPHVAGGAALVLEYMKQNDLFKDLTGAEKVEQAKTLLMNTAVPLVDPDVKTFYSPRREGAGLMKLDAAVTTPVYVTAKDTNAPKVNLKEITSNKFDFTLTLTNFSDKDVTYKVDTKPLTDLIGKDKDGTLLNAEAAQEIKDAKVSVDSEVTVQAGKTKDVTVSIDLSDADKALTALMKNGYFVEGFVTFKDVKDEAPSLSVPYLGFKGDWNQPPVLDAMVYDDEESFYGVSKMVDENGYDLGFDPVKEEFYKDKIAISPNGDGESDAITPVLSFLRNSKSVEYSILDKDKKQIRKLNVDYDQRKNYYDASRPGSYYSYDSLNEWNGKANNKVVPDGKYYYQIKSQIDYAGKDPQVVQVPVIVDTKAPIINNLKYDKGVLSFNAADDGSGISYYEIIANGELLGYLSGDAQAVAIPDLEKASIIVRAFDYAGNSATVTNEVNDGTIPYLDPSTSEPEALGVYGEKEVPFSGKITAKSPIDKLEVRINTQKGAPYKVVKTHWNKEDATYDFDDTITFKEDGVHEIFVLGVDQKGNKLQFARKVFVDTTAPTIDVKGLPAKGQVDVNTKEVKVTATIADNFDVIRFVMNGDQIEKTDLKEPYEQRKYSNDFPLTLSLDDKPGENIFELQLTDLAGHVTTKVIKINKVVPLAPKVNPVSDKDTKVTGTASKNATILVKNGTKLVGANTVDKDGKFRVTLNGKQKAGSKLTVVAKVGEYESKATTVTVLDKTAPAAPKVNTVSDKDTKVTGKAEAGSKVTVKAGKSTLGTATADKAGKFTVKIKKQKAGTKLSVTATDKAKNVSKATTVTVVDKTAPKAPTVNTVTSSTTKVTGKAEAGSTVTIKAGKKKLGSAKADKNGKFSVKIKAQKAGTKLSVTATDKAKNVSKAKNVTVQTPTPTVNTVKSSSTKVTGKAKAGSTVYVKAGSKTLGHAKASKSGKYTVKIKKQKAGKTLTVYAVENGKKSASKKVVVKK